MRLTSRGGSSVSRNLTGTCLRSTKLDLFVRAFRDNRRPKSDTRLMNAPFTDSKQTLQEFLQSAVKDLTLARCLGVTPLLMVQGDIDNTHCTCYTYYA